MVATSIKLSLFIGILAVVIYNSDYIFKFKHTKEEYKFTPKEEDDEEIEVEEVDKAAIEKAILAQTEVILAEECDPSERCYIITDQVRKYKNRIQARRFMAIKNSPIINTIMRLYVPDKPTWKDVETKNWSINKRIVVSDYMAMLIASGYITEALSFETQKKQQLLLIGLGGGAASGFFTTIPNVEMTAVEIDPFMVLLAEKYFDHTNEKGETNVVIQDGIEFIKESVQHGRKYRSILIDASYNNDITNTGLLCPISEFFREDVIRNIYNSLENKGVVSINLLSVKNTEIHEEGILEVYSKIFPSCWLAPYKINRNALVCSKRKNWTWDKQPKLFTNNLKEVIKRFSFYDLTFLPQHLEQ